MEVKIQIIDNQGKVYHGTLVLTKQTKSKREITRHPKQTQKSLKIKPSEIIYQNLYQKKFFQNYKLFSEVEKKINELGYHFKKGSVLMALKGAEYLVKSGKKRNYKFIQKYPPKE